MQATSLYRPKDFTNKYDARKPWLPQRKRLIKQAIDKAESIAGQIGEAAQGAKAQAIAVIDAARLGGFFAGKIATSVAGIALIGVGQWLLQ